MIGVFILTGAAMIAGGVQSYLWIKRYHGRRLAVARIMMWAARQEEDNS